MGWEIWDDIHENEEQIKRQKSATKSACTPLSIENGVGVFRGKSGEYSTTLEKCPCMDFSRRRKPCKHMYRLSIELGYFSADNVQSDTGSVLVPQEQHEAYLIHLVSILENYPLWQQLAFKNVICALTFANQKEYFTHAFPLLVEMLNTDFLCFYRDFTAFSSHYRKKDMISMISELNIPVPDTAKTQKAKIEWVMKRLDIYGDLMFPIDLFVTMPSGMGAVGRHFYKYLHRKFDDDASLAWEDCYGNLNVPNDEATRVLKLFGTTPDY